MMFTRILTVCTGNICRSPLAAAELRLHLPANIHVRSSGISAVVGAPAQKTVQKLAKQRNLDLSGHEGTQITESMALDSDLILVMTGAHKEELERRFPVVRGRIFLLGQWGVGEIPDPYGGSEALYKTVDTQIQTAVKQWLPKLETGGRG